jgi:8-amino-7-oxononanoate synthase
MSLLERIGSNKTMLRLLSDDRFMNFTNGVMDAKNRFSAARQLAQQALVVLRDGQALPNIDPALDGGDADVVDGSRPRPAPQAGATNGAAAKLANVGGKDVFEKCFQFMTTDNARERWASTRSSGRSTRTTAPRPSARRQEVMMLGSNNYLGLTTHPKVREAAKQAIDEYGTSMTGSRLVNGSMKLHNELEDQARRVPWARRRARLHHRLPGEPRDHLGAALEQEERRRHRPTCTTRASTTACGSRRRRRGWSATSTTSLRALDRRSPSSRTRARSSSPTASSAPRARSPPPRDAPDHQEAQGAPLHRRRARPRRHRPLGRGTAHFGLADVDLIGGTFSKSLASIGGWLVGDRKVLDYIRHFAFSFLFAASAAPPCVAAAMAALDVMQEEPWRQEKLRENFTYMRTELRRMGFELGTTDTAVIPIYIRQDLRTVMMWKSLLDDYSIYVNPFITPGVPPKQQVLRTSYMATHERAHLDRALEAFEKVGKKFGVIG